MPSRFVWNVQRANMFLRVGPERAHKLAAVQAAGLAARRINSKGTGDLARDVSRPKPKGRLRTLVGSGKPYARIENDGGTIHARNGRMMIQGRGRSSPVTASARSVPHRGKHYLEVAQIAFPKLFIVAYRRVVK